MSAEEKIRRLLAEFAHRADSGDFAGWVALFAPEGRMILFGQDHAGPEALRRFIEADQPAHKRGLHYTTDSLITLGEGQAEVVSHFLFVAPGSDGPVTVTGGRYHDVLVERGGEWLFMAREARLVLPVATRAWGRDA